MDRLKATNQTKEDEMVSGGVKVGIKAPDFCLPDQEEKSVCLRDYKGRWVVLYCYPKDDTPGCTTEACDFTNSLAAFEKLDVAVLGMSPDSPQSHVRFSEKHHLKLTLLSDPETHHPRDLRGLGAQEKLRKGDLGGPPEDVPDRPRGQDPPHLAQGLCGGACG
jgi:peroxiredoxin